MHYSQVNNTLKTLSEEIKKLKKELETTYHSTQKAHHSDSAEKIRKDYILKLEEKAALLLATTFEQENYETLSDESQKKAASYLSEYGLSAVLNKLPRDLWFKY